MKIQNISQAQQNKQNFQGKINIIPGDLSYLPAKYVRNAYDAMEKQIQNKPFDLFIIQNHKQNTVSIIARNGNKGMFAEAVIDKNADIYEESVNRVITEYEKMQKKNKPTFKERLKNLADKAWHKFLVTVEIEDGNL